MKYLFVGLGMLLLTGCTIEMGDNPPPTGLILDEDFFYCRIMPEVIIAQTCASGASGDTGGCHSSRSVRLDPMAETDTPPVCDADVLVGAPPASYRDNLGNLRFTISVDPLSSGFYRRPVELDPHPREIFPEGSPEAELIAAWITDGI
jgi:hypothetical protein